MGLVALKSEVELKDTLLRTLAQARTEIIGETVDRVIAERIAGMVRAPLPTEAAKTSMLIPRHRQVVEALQGIASELSTPAPGEMKGIAREVLEALPSFVYYSNYGNLDSEIYLPHVIDNLQRSELGPKDQAKPRTMKVLFEFVRLSAEEILELGRDFEHTRNREPTQIELDAIAEKKKQRSILLQSASTDLTARLRDLVEAGGISVSLRGRWFALSHLGF